MHGYSCLYLIQIHTNMLEGEIGHETISWSCISIAKSMVHDKSFPNRERLPAVPAADDHLEFSVAYTKDTGSNKALQEWSLDANNDTLIVVILFFCVETHNMNETSRQNKTMFNSTLLVVMTAYDQGKATTKYTNRRNNVRIAKCILYLR